MADDLIFDEDTSPASTGASFSSDEQTLVTKEGLRQLKEELEELKTKRRGEVAVRLKEAISFGDLSENSEYEEAKNEQAFVEGRIMELEMKIKNAKIITEKKDSTNKAAEIGSTVTVRNVTDGDEPEKYTIVGSTEANPFEGKIGNESPIARALLGAVKGETVTVQSPSGMVKYEVVHVAA